MRRDWRVLLPVFAVASIAGWYFTRSAPASRPEVPHLTVPSSPSPEVKPDSRIDLHGWRSKLNQLSSLSVAQRDELTKELGTCALVDPQSLTTLILDPGILEIGRVFVTQILAAHVRDAAIGVLSPLLDPGLPLSVLKSLLAGLVRRDASGLADPLFDLLDQVRKQPSSDRSVMVLGFKVLIACADESVRKRLFAILDDPDWSEFHALLVRELGPSLTRKDIAGILRGYVKAAQSGTSKDIGRVLDGLGAADAQLLAEAVQEVLSSLPEGSKQEINAKNRIIATLMSNDSSGATALLEAIALSQTGKHGRVQAIHALGNVPRERAAEILLAVLAADQDAEIVAEVASVLRRIKGLDPSRLQPFLESAVRDGNARYALTLAGSILEANAPESLSPEMKVLVTQVAETHGAGRVEGVKVLVLSAALAPDPGARLIELAEDPQVQWRVMNSTVSARSELPGMPEMLLKVARQVDCPDRYRIRAIAAVGKAGRFHELTGDVFSRIAQTDRSSDCAAYAYLVRKFGTEADKSKLAEFIKSLPRGSKKNALERVDARIPDLKPWIE